MIYNKDLRKDVPFVAVFKKKHYLPLIIKDTPTGMGAYYKYEMVPFKGIITRWKHNAVRPIVTICAGTTPSGKFYPGITGLALPRSDFFGNEHKVSTEVPNAIGTATIDAGGIAKDFSTSNKLTLPEPLPNISSISFSYTFKIMLKEKRGHADIFANTSQEQYLSIRKCDHLAAYVGSWVDGKTVLEKNQWYWVRCVKEGSNFNYYLLKDDGYVLSGLPDTSKWSLEFTNTTDFYSNNTMNIGFNYAVPDEYFKGDIDLDQAIIMRNDAVFWDNRRTQVKEYSLPGLLDEDYNPENATYFNVFYDGKNTTLSYKEDLEGQEWISDVIIGGTVNP